MRKRMCLIMLIATPLLADEPKVPPSSTTDKTETKIIYKKSEKHAFSGSKLKGQLKKPELSYIYERKGMRQEKIVNIPLDFNQEIIDGAGQF